jgi:fermentation-respiration switch protein FrsA (DUF1100 family)
MVMCHGLSGVKEMALEPFATRFADAGYAVLTFDHRYLGESEGTPRGRLDPTIQHDDIRAALDFMVSHPQVDEDRIALWGNSYGGGHALFIGALDLRVKAVTVVVPGIGSRGILRKAGRGVWDAMLKQVAEDFTRRNTTGESELIPIVAAPGERCLLPQPSAREWILREAKKAPAWKNSVTLESLQRSIEYSPTEYIDLISPRPLLIIAAEADEIVPIEMTREAFAVAGEPKRLEVLPCGHFEIEEEQFRTKAVDIQVQWLQEVL